MPTHKLVKIHGNILVVQLGPHDVVPVLQETGNAEKHQERVSLAKLWWWGKAAKKKKICEMNTIYKYNFNEVRKHTCSIQLAVQSCNQHCQKDLHQQNQVLPLHRER